jgi:hypothetical protein
MKLLVAMPVVYQARFMIWMKPAMMMAAAINQSTDQSL